MNSSTLQLPRSSEMRIKEYLCECRVLLFYQDLLDSSNSLHSFGQGCFFNVVFWWEELVCLPDDVDS